jgi:ElaB/YqjD/DUF883 family membrane-anchored ribosome-binding protein
MSEYTPSDQNDVDASNHSAERSAEFEAARERLRAAYATAREKSAQAIGRTEEYTRKSPLEALGYAAGVGAVLGVLAVLLFGGKR